MFGFLAGRHVGILAPPPGMEPQPGTHTPPALEGKVLTTGLPGKSHNQYNIFDIIIFFFKGSKTPLQEFVFQLGFESLLCPLVAV